MLRDSSASSSWSWAGGSTRRVLSSPAAMRCVASDASRIGRVSRLPRTDCGSQPEQDRCDRGPNEEPHGRAQTGVDAARHHDHVEPSVRSGAVRPRTPSLPLLSAWSRRGQPLGLQLLDGQPAGSSSPSQRAVGFGDQHRDLVDRHQRPQGVQHAQPVAQLPALPRSRSWRCRPPECRRCWPRSRWPARAGRSVVARARTAASTSVPAPASSRVAITTPTITSANRRVIVARLLRGRCEHCVSQAGSRCPTPSPAAGRRRASCAAGGRARRRCGRRRTSRRPTRRRAAAGATARFPGCGRGRRAGRTRGSPAATTSSRQRGLAAADVDRDSRRRCA